MRHYRTCIGTALLALAACLPGPESAADSVAAAALSADADSATSMTWLLRRFQRGIDVPPERLADASPTRDALVQRFLVALERNDVSALESMRVSRAEFAYLFFPESIFMRPPYELDPAVVWLQIDAGSNSGLPRALQRYAGKPLGYLGLVCQPPQAQGSVLLHGCDVRRATAAGDTVRERMFGGILERAGQFKFLSFENKL